MKTTAQALRAEARNVRQCLHRRNQLIRTMSAEGASLREIAEVCEMSHSGVKLIIEAGSDPRLRRPIGHR